MSNQIPAFFPATFAVFRMELEHYRRGNKFRLGVLATALVVFAVAVAHHAGISTNGLDVQTAAERAQQSVHAGFEFGYFRLLVFLLPFLFASASISEEVERGTFAYLLTRPINRVSIGLGKWLAATVATGTILLTSLLLLHVITYVTEPTALFEAFPDTLRVAFAAVMLSTLYCAICLTFGAVAPHASGVLPATYLAFLEFGCSFMPSVIRLLSFNFAARRLAGFEVGGFLPDTVPDIPAALGFGILFGGICLFLTLALLAVRFGEFHSNA